ncbi:DUF368 domain-containing protein [Marinospirillum alkaliphilum]|uniref:Putative membrane protein n=1 Tax=Marinospirillum alkaliphilum DSM 21637 TaxID=1122209 RepID=A0A1K1VAI4_9GAMM|nr:DUF368 domain-containing protein [Marinospirillum alkaliphilum]SFX21764.1 putative membrane protein [Marinospirillum alkaliphilum DSM 21637]
MKLWQIYLRGLFMGAADVVPGVSGGTVAFITGIYERLINSLRSFDQRLWGVWKQQGLRGIWQAVDGLFLLTLLSGILSSILLLAHLISWLLVTWPHHLNGFFFGLVAGSAIIISRQVPHWSFSRILFIGLGALVSSLLTLLLPAIGTISTTTFFLAGMIAICAMILPGISGSFLLLVMGLYAPLVEAVKTLQSTLLLAFAMGAGVGLLAFSHLLGWLFDHYRSATFATLFGFVISSLPHIWPWQLLTRYRISEDGKVLPLDTQMLLPWHFTQITGEPSFFISVTLLALIGWILVLLLAPRNH